MSVQRYVNDVLFAFDADALALPTITTQPVDGRYEFAFLDAGDTNGDITIKAAGPAAADPRVGFSSDTDMGSIGELLAEINGDLALSERSGDFRVRNVSSSAGDVSLSATGNGGDIYDLDGSEATPYGTTPWVTGNRVALRSSDGGIGSAENGIISLDPRGM